MGIDRFTAVLGDVVIILILARRRPRAGKVDAVLPLDNSALTSFEVSFSPTISRIMVGIIDWENRRVKNACLGGGSG
jgi:hypothetical protein